MNLSQITSPEGPDILTLALEGQGGLREKAVGLLFKDSTLVLVLC